MRKSAPSLFKPHCVLSFHHGQSNLLCLHLTLTDHHKRSFFHHAALLTMAQWDVGAAFAGATSDELGRYICNRTAEYAIHSGCTNVTLKYLYVLEAEARTCVAKKISLASLNGLRQSGLRLPARQASTIGSLLFPINGAKITPGAGIPCTALPSFH